ncbi:MAG: hypothetical protein M3507_07280 [Actinomycetota bacterium]|nr:hypothetical protein [Actinomycetota bacterium]
MTGVAVGGDEIVADEAYADDGRLVLTPAFYRDHADSVFYWGLYVDLAGDEADLASFRAGVERLAGEEAIEFQTSALTTATVQRAIRPQAVALALFAVVVGLAGLLVAGQALARQLGADAGDAPTLDALGMSRRQRLAVHLLRAVVVAAGGAILATLVAFGLSLPFPIGAARLAEPHPGFASTCWLWVVAPWPWSRSSPPAWPSRPGEWPASAISAPVPTRDGTDRRGRGPPWPGPGWRPAP